MYSELFCAPRPSSSSSIQSKESAGISSPFRIKSIQLEDCFQLNSYAILSARQIRLEGAFNRFGIILWLASTFLLLTASAAVLAQEGDADYRWVPNQAHSLIPIADEIHRARNEKDEAALQLALGEFSKAIIENPPSGGFPVSENYWIGPGQYLKELMQLVSQEVRHKNLARIDNELFTHFGKPPTRLSLNRVVPIFRDFPDSQFARSYREEFAEKLLEAGYVSAYQEVSEAPEIETVDLLGFDDYSLSTPNQSISSKLLNSPLHAVHKINLLAALGRTDSVRNPFTGLQDFCAQKVGKHLYIAQPHQMLCIDSESNTQLWTQKVPRVQIHKDGILSSLERHKASLPGSPLKPVVFGESVIHHRPAAVTVFNRFTGQVSWCFFTKDLFSIEAKEETAANKEEPNQQEQLADEAAEQKNEQPSILSMSLPQICEEGIVFVVSASQDGSLKQVLVLLDRHGSLVWKRSLGSAAGATYLGLGMSSPIVKVYSGQAFILSQRGFLSCLNLSDGSLKWATSYESYGYVGSHDSLVHNDRFLRSDMHIDENLLVASPIDSAWLYVWEHSTGKLLQKIPREASRWSTMYRRPHQNSYEVQCEVGLVQKRQFSIWQIAGLVSPKLKQIILPSDLPDFCGPANKLAQYWFIPHSAGYYRVSEDMSWTYHELRLPYQIENVQAFDDGKILASNPNRADLFVPCSSFQLQEKSTRGLCLRAQAALLEKDFESLQAALAELSKLNKNTHSTDLDSQAGVRPLGQMILRYARYNQLPAEADEKLALVKGVLASLPRDRYFAQAAYDQATSAANFGHLDVAMEFAYLALQARKSAPIKIREELRCNIELAISRLLQAILAKSTEPQILLSPHEKIAQNRLKAALLEPSAFDLSQISRQFPHTAAGRNSALYAAQEYFKGANWSAALDILNYLVLTDGKSKQSLEARLRIAEIYLEQEDFAEARAQLIELKLNFGNEELILLGPAIRGNPLSGRADSNSERAASLVKVDQLADSLLKQTLGVSLHERPQLLSSTAKLEAIWRTRTELTHQRSLMAFPLSQHAPGVADNQILLVAHRRVELRSAHTGESFWALHFSGEAQGNIEGFAQRKLRLRMPIGFLQNYVYLNDQESIYCLDFLSGAVQWQKRLPKAPIDELPNSIQFAGLGSECLVVGSSDGFLRAYQHISGKLLWEHKAKEGDFLDSPSFFPGRVSLTSFAPTRVVSLDLATGKEVWKEVPVPEALRAEEAGLEPESCYELCHAPQALDEKSLLIAIKDGRLRCLHAADGTENWSLQLPSLLRKIHLMPNLPFIIAEMKFKKSMPLLYGIDPQSGQILWQKVFEGRRYGFSDVLFSKGNLFLLESRYSKMLYCLEVPPVFMNRTNWHALQEAQHLKQIWQQRTRRSFSTPKLSVQGQDLLLYYPNDCDLSVHSRASGRAIVKQRYAPAFDFLFGRQKLHFCEFVGNTLVMFTSQGGAGFRDKNSLENYKKIWLVLQQFNPLDSSQSLPATGTALVAYREHSLDQACRLLEGALNRPGLIPIERRQLSLSLEGISQELEENKPQFWNVGAFSQPPRIDGRLDEDWHVRDSASIRTARYIHSMQGPNEDAASWRDWRDLSAKVFTGYSDKGFHVAIEVTDDNIRPYDREASNWKGDCFLLALDMKDNGGLRPFSDDQLLTMALTVPRQAGPPPANAGDAQEAEDKPEEKKEEEPEGDFQVRRKRDGSGVIYEVTVPWATFKKARNREEPDLPYPGMSFRMNIVLTDDDTGLGAESYLSLSPGQKLREETKPSHIWDLFAPAYFPRLKLE